MCLSILTVTRSAVCHTQKLRQGKVFKTPPPPGQNLVARVREHTSTRDMTAPPLARDINMSQKLIAAPI